MESYTMTTNTIGGCLEMAENQKESNVAVLREEEAIKESVYQFFVQRMKETSAVETEAKTLAENGGFESQFQSLYSSEYARAREEKYRTHSLIETLYKEPYFGHIRVFVEEDGCSHHYLMSECPELDEAKRIKGTKEEIYLLPFKQDEHRKIYSALYHTWQAKTGEMFSVPNVEGVGETRYLPELIREVQIRSGKLEYASQLYPQLDFNYDEDVIDFDDLLARRLNENRDNAHLRSIIATLQREQYDIVQTDLNTSMVVQGCAGSGKSQCLIHRLFFMRDELSANGWERVLLITPTQLFRNYSAELMHRFHLTSVANASIAELYRNLLNAADSRFRNRQYKFELSEEYLPDEYLHQVYAEENILKIRSEISNAIEKHVAECCILLGLTLPESPISVEMVNSLVDALSREISSYDAREKELAEDEEFLSKRAEIEAAQAKLNAAKNSQLRTLTRLAELRDRRSQFDVSFGELKKAEDELSLLELQSKDKLEAIHRRLNTDIAALSGNSIACSSLSRLNAYCESLSAFLSASRPWGEKMEDERTQLEFFRRTVSLRKDALEEITKGKSPTAWKHLNEKELSECENKLKKLNEDIYLNEMLIAEGAEWLQSHSDDSDLRKQNKARRASLEKARYYLSRIESSVFEQEIWDTLAPLKERCGIKTIETELLPDGKRKETRILYKSDLLFYLHIYMSLGEATGLQDYGYICIDEGQDLHKADYETLRELYPNAVFNVFGDIAQALHVDCGISDWASETGIDTVFELTTNYRNTPATVDFCRNRFNVKMEPCGKIHDEHRPVVLSTDNEIESLLSTTPPTVIVKDREAFEELLSCAGAMRNSLYYLDTNSTKEKENTIPCYSIYAAKGLEFSNVLVFAAHMTSNQKVVACTRAIEKLYFFE